MSEMSREHLPLKRRVVEAGLWTIGGYALGQLVRLASNLLMTRLLLPEMFGVVTLAYLVMTGLTLLSDVGLVQNIVQSERGGDPRFLNTAWILQIVRGILLWIAAVGVAALILAADYLGLVPAGTVYADSRLPYVIAILASTAVFTGLRSTKFYEAYRDLAFGRVTLLGIAGQAAGLVCMLAWASVDRSVWALVSGGICSTVTQTILSHAWLGGAPNRWEWDRSASAEIFRFGRWIFASSILGFLASNADRLLLGSMVDATVLGIYVIAFLLFSSVEQILARIVQSVGFPALSEIVRERKSLKAVYYRFHAVIAGSSYASAGFLMMSGQALVDILYDRRYSQAGWMLEALAIGLVSVPSQIGVQCYMALGASGLTAIVAGVRLLVLLILLPVGFSYWGLPGALAGIVLSYLSALPTTILISRRYDLLDARKELSVLPAILLGMLAGKLLTLAIGSLLP